MIVTWRIGLRLALIIAVTVVLQISFFSYLDLLGSAPDVVPVVIVSLGLLGGGVVGAVCGFGAGLLLDSVLLQTLGVSSLTLLSIGYLAGRYREGFEISNAFVAPLLTGGLTLLGAAGEDQRVVLEPFADIRDLEYVQVLTGVPRRPGVPR